MKPICLCGHSLSSHDYLGCVNCNCGKYQDRFTPQGEL